MRLIIMARAHARARGHRRQGFVFETGRTGEDGFSGESAADEGGSSVVEAGSSGILSGGRRVEAILEEERGVVGGRVSWRRARMEFMRSRFLFAVVVWVVHIWS